MVVPRHSPLVYPSPFRRVALRASRRPLIPSPSTSCRWAVDVPAISNMFADDAQLFTQDKQTLRGKAAVLKQLEKGERRVSLGTLFHCYALLLDVLPYRAQAWRCSSGWEAGGTFPWSRFRKPLQTKKACMSRSAPSSRACAASPSSRSIPLQVERSCFFATFVSRSREMKTRRYILRSVFFPHSC